MNFGQHERRGHSMMEMVVVMSVLAGMAALSYPMLRSPVNKLRLQSAGQEVATELAKARVKAMQSGVAQVFRVQLHTGRFQVMAASESARESAGDAKTEQADQTVAEVVSNSSPERSPMSEPMDDLTEEKELPDGIVFEAPETDDVPSPPTRDSISAEDVEGWTEFAVFYPDGCTTNAAIGLRDSADICLDVKLSGLTGAAKIGEAHRQELR